MCCHGPNISDDGKDLKLGNKIDLQLFDALIKKKRDASHRGFHSISCPVKKRTIYVNLIIVSHQFSHNIFVFRLKLKSFTKFEDTTEALQGKYTNKSATNTACNIKSTFLTDFSYIHKVTSARHFITVSDQNNILKY